MPTASPPNVGPLNALVFDDPDIAVAAVVALRADGYTIDDVYTPFPVHGMADAMDLPETRLPWATLIGGLTGLTTALVLQIFVHTMSWPLNIGGKTFLALPAMIPVAFELTVLFSGIATGVGLFMVGRLWPRLSGETPAEQVLAEASDDRYVVVLDTSAGDFSREQFETFAAGLQAEKIL